MKIRTIIIIFILVVTVLTGGTIIRQNGIYGYYRNHTEYRDYYRKIGRDLKTDKIIVDFINTILPYYDLTYENSKAEFEARAEKIQDITYAYKANLSLDDRLKIVEFQVKAIKEK